VKVFNSFKAQWLPYVFSNQLVNPATSSPADDTALASVLTYYGWVSLIFYYFCCNSEK
jgi:hypothetical protein